MPFKPEVFDEGYVPQDFVHRDQKLGALEEALEPLVDCGQPQTPFLHGPPGAGKTSSMRYLLDQLEAESPSLETTLVNCWRDHQGWHLYRQLLADINAPTRGIPTRTVPHEALLHRLESALDHRFLVVLDEVDQLDDLSILHDLQRLDLVSLVLIANETDRVFARLGGHDALQDTVEIHYDSYHTQEIVEILERRVDAGAHGTETLGMLEYIAELAGGDAREAIQTLYEAVKLMRSEDRGVLGREFVDRGHPVARSKIRQKTSSRLGRHERTLLELLRNRGELSMGELYDAYVDLVGEDDARSRRRCRDYLEKMQSYNLVTASGEKRGRTYRVISTPAV